MKTKTLLFLLGFYLVLSASGQKATIELTFTAEDGGTNMPIDSILIQNLTQGGEMMLYAPDTVLELNYTGIFDSRLEEANFNLSQNYPNPFNGKTEVNLYLKEKDNIRMVVSDLLGREVARYENTLGLGNHSFVFYAGAECHYLLSVTGNKSSRTIKMVNKATELAGACRISYNSNTGNSAEFKSQQAVNDFVFDLGDKLKCSGWSGMRVRTRIEIPMEDQTYTFHYAGNPCPGTPTVTDIEGNVYNTVQIGDQCWMAENLKTITYNNGSAITNVPDFNDWVNLTSEAYVWYNNDIQWKDIYGAMYNWYAASNAQGLCPTGWKVPSDDDWGILFDYIGGITSPHANELKTCRQVNSPSEGLCVTEEHPRWDAFTSDWGTNNYNFNALPGGSRTLIFGGGNFVYLGKGSSFWTSTVINADEAWAHFLFYDNGGVDKHNSIKINGYYVRCIKD